MNERSVEYGWRIEGHGFKSLYQAMGFLQGNPGTEGALDALCYIKEIKADVETHPWDPTRWFVSLGELMDKFPKEPKRGAKAVKQWAKRFAPKAKVVWGPIYLAAGSMFTSTLGLPIITER